MKNSALVVIALCSYVIFCSRGTSEDTNDPNVWARQEEPRLSGASRWVPCRRLPRAEGEIVGRVDCAPRPPASNDDCLEPLEVTKRDEALRVLLTQPACTDVAISVLSRISPDDLAAAYYIRAQRNDDPADLLRAADAAQRARPTATTLFNRALAYEALELHTDAAVAWDAFLGADRGSGWAEEARERRKRLVATDSIDQWEHDAARLVSAVSSDNPALVAEIVRRSPAAAQRLIEEELLPDDLKGAKLIAAELFRLTQDPFALDLVRAFSQTRDAVSLRKGHETLRQARLLDRAFERPAAALQYKEATELLSRGGSPLALLSSLRSSNDVDDVATEARKRGYMGVLARAHATRGHMKGLAEFEYVAAIQEYDAALSAYAAVHDAEGLAATHTRLSGIHRLMGDTAGAWAQALRALRLASSQTNTQERHVLLGEAAHAAMELGHPAV
ncbi:MAG TPA: hypothetical protein VF911_03785, partial [Thermoanaerobaculia bacterium]